MHLFGHAPFSFSVKSQQNNRPFQGLRSHVLKPALDTKKNPPYLLGTLPLALAILQKIAFLRLATSRTRLGTRRRNGIVD